MKFQDDVRYEFRVFGSDLADVRNSFAEMGAPQPQPASRETYIVTRLNIESNVKVRADRLEVKMLRARTGLLEQWAPVLRSSFPVSVQNMEDVVAPALGIELELEDAESMTERALIAFAKDQHSLAPVVVEKNRTLFDLGACEAEFSELKIEGDRLQTAAFEAIELEAAQNLLRRIGLESAENESYAAFLQRRLF